MFLPFRCTAADQSMQFRFHQQMRKSVLIRADLLLFDQAHRGRNRRPGRGRIGAQPRFGVTQRAALEAALAAGILCFNLESAAELQVIERVAARLGVRAPVSVRTMVSRHWKVSTAVT